MVSPPTSWRSKSKRGLIRFVILFALLYLGILIMLAALENSLVFPASGADVGNWNPAGDYEDVHLTSADGTRLHGWFLPHENARGHVLHLHGNGGNIAYRWIIYDRIHQTLGVSVFALDYRGYGKSEGSPNEAGVIADAEAARAWLAERTGIHPAEVILYGESLGGGVAVDLASRTVDGKPGAKALILKKTFASLPDVAARVLPFLPVRLIMRNRFDSVAKIGRFNGPVFHIHGDPDGIVPIQSGRKLFEAANEPKEFLRIPDLDHNEIVPENFYQRQVDEFLTREGVLTPRTPSE